MRIGEPEWFHRAMTQSLKAAFRHDFNRQAAVEVGCVCFPFMEALFIPGQQCRNKCMILLTRQRAVDVIGARAAGARLVVTRLEPGLAEVDTVAMDNGSDSVEERKLLFAGQSANCGGEVGRCEGACRHNHAVPLLARYDFATLERHQRM